MGNGMKLSEIKIVNFRSIADISILPEPSCQGFVGINESGKTNVLTAISLLSPDIKLNKNDVRMESADEERELDSYVKYSFELSKSEIEEVVNDLLNSIYCETPLSKMNIPGKKITIADFFYKKNIGLYWCDINTETKNARYFSLNKNEILPIPWLKSKSSKISATTVVSKSGNTIPLSQFHFIEADCIDDADATQFETCTTNDLNKIFGASLVQYVERNLPNVVYWKYDSKYLLPSNINIEMFKNDPTSCIPLKAMFNLAGYDNIEEFLTSIKEKRTNKLTNILNKVSEKSTKYLHQVWHDYKSVRFELRSNGDNIDIHIQDSENFYDCEQRSDGFKRFVTFLLALSARVNNGEIKDSIIIIDEPDQGIHILGQKNLVQELIKISANNIVFYSTHSIFMIDRKNPSRHYIVSKKNEITTINQVTESNYTDDEVLLNALGYSIFEALKPINIIFEGWADKRVFELALSTSKGKQLKSLNTIGKVHANGVKSIIGLAKNIELADRVYCVISDSDNPSLDIRKKYQDNDQCKGVWYTYNDIIDGIFTLEDFIKHATFKRAIEKAKLKFSMNDFDYKAFELQTYKREDFIKNWISNCVSNTGHAQQIIKEIKNDLYSCLVGSNIEDSYYTFLRSLNEKLGN